MKDAIIIKPFHGNAFVKPEQYAVSCLNWPEFSAGVSAAFSANHDGKRIVIDFIVSETGIAAKNTKINSPVYQDSCVEFFISFDRVNYYNFEFNCIGTVLAQYGSSRSGRVFIAPEILRKIEVMPSLGKEPFDLLEGAFSWSLKVVIPAEAFVFDKITELSGVTAAGNFYKCGDNLAQKHYLSLFPVKTEKPDFHRPEFFGEIKFI